MTQHSENYDAADDRAVNLAGAKLMGADLRAISQARLSSDQPVNRATRAW